MTESGRRYFLVDAFADRPFAGNPAAVVPLDSWPADDWLQLVAREMNQSETAYFVRCSAEFDLRWFTPTVEVDLCGHATLATAAVIWEQRLVGREDEIKFATRSGKLRAIPAGDEIELDFPLKPAQAAPPPPGLLEALGVVARFVGSNRTDYLVEVESAAVVRGMNPDFSRLAAVSCRGVIVTARADHAPYDFVSRFFAPAAGINEDPVTGSAHCCLADYWRTRLGKSEFCAYQASARGGVVGVRIDGDRVRLRGRAILTARGELLVS